MVRLFSYNKLHLILYISLKIQLAYRTIFLWCFSKLPQILAALLQIPLFSFYAFWHFHDSNDNAHPQYYIAICIVYFGQYWCFCLLIIMVYREFYCRRHCLWIGSVGDALGWWELNPGCDSIPQDYDSSVCTHQSTICCRSSATEGSCLPKVYFVTLLRILGGLVASLYFEAHSSFAW